MPVAHTSLHASCECLGIHRHAQAQAALVLEGSYQEASSDGRFDCRPGVLTIHPQWHQHMDHFGNSGAVVLNLPLPEADGYGLLQIADIESLSKLARSCPLSAALAASEEAATVDPIAPAGWLVQLTTLLARDHDTHLSRIAMRCGVSTEHAIRACKRWFGLSPAALRREWRLQRAIALLKAGASPAEVAYEVGFSDQPHLTRLLKRATGLTPARFARA
jgi:AraC-like DNA-binding protein